MEQRELSPDDLNGIATLLHITSEIATNHPQLGGIQRACQRMLAKINADLVVEEAKEVEAAKQARAKQQAADYKAPKPGDADYIAPEEEEGSVLLDRPVDELPPVERRV